MMNNRNRLVKRLMTNEELFCYGISDGILTLLNTARNFGKPITVIWNSKLTKNNAYAFRKKRSK